MPVSMGIPIYTRLTEHFPVCARPGMAATTLTERGRGVPTGKNPGIGLRRVPVPWHVSGNKLLF